MWFLIISQFFVDLLYFHTSLADLLIHNELIKLNIEKINPINVGLIKRNIVVLRRIDYQLALLPNGI